MREMGGRHAQWFGSERSNYLLLPDIHFHDLRHGTVTLLLSQGVHPKVVQELLGHNQISMTMDTYSHVLPTMQQEVMSKLDDAPRQEQKDGSPPDDDDEGLAGASIRRKPRR